MHSTDNLTQEDDLCATKHGVPLPNEASTQIDHFKFPTGWRFYVGGGDFYAVAFVMLLKLVPKNKYTIC